VNYRSDQFFFLTLICLEAVLLPSIFFLDFNLLASGTSSVPKYLSYLIFISTLILKKLKL
jgi:hypothetical protein